MRSALFSFAFTAALLSLNLIPDMWPAQAQSAAEARHSKENKADIEAELGLSVS
jgi:hypothetical protein